MLSRPLCQPLPAAGLLAGREEPYCLGGRGRQETAKRSNALILSVPVLPEWLYPPSLSDKHSEKGGCELRARSLRGQIVALPLDQVPGSRVKGA